MALLTGSEFLSAQQVISTGGNYFSNTKISASYTLGENIIDTYTASLIVTTGFQQPGLRYKISGTLKYKRDSLPSLPLKDTILRGVTVYLKNAHEPIPPAVLPIPSIIASAITDSTGYFEIYAENGSYYLYASSNEPWAINSVTMGDLINLRRYFSGLEINSIGNNSLRQKAADVSSDGVVNMVDIKALRNKLANIENFNAPNWLFENPLIKISDSSVNNVKIHGICSGELNGTYGRNY